jgi:glutaredoxin
MSVIVYTRASCDDCMATLALLNELQLEFEVRPEEALPSELLTLEEKFARVTEVIYADSASSLRPILPKVVTPYGDWWSGHRPDELRELATDMAPELVIHERTRQKRARTHHQQLTAV